MNDHTDLSTGSMNLFVSIANDAHDWSGTPLLDELSAVEKGHLTDLKKRGLLTTTQDEDNRRCFWVYFTDEGVELAKRFGIDLSIYR